MKCQTIFVKTLQKDPNGDCRYRTVVRNAKKLSVIEAGRLRECKNTEFVWELRKRGVAKAAIKRAVHLLQCAKENFHCACALLVVQLFLNISPHCVPWHALIPVFTATFFLWAFWASGITFQGRNSREKPTASSLLYCKRSKSQSFAKIPKLLFLNCLPNFLFGAFLRTCMSTYM